METVTAIPALLCATMAAGALWIALLTSAPAITVPNSVKDSMRSEAVSTARSLSESIDRVISSVRSNPSIGDGDASTLPIGTDLDGFEVLNRSGALLTGAGNAVSTSARDLPGSAEPRVVRKGGALLVLVPTSPGRLVVAQLRTRQFEHGEAGHTATVVTLDGTPVSGQLQYDTRLSSLVRAATNMSTTEHQGFLSSSESVFDDGDSGGARRARAAAAARIPGLAADADVAVAIAGEVPAVEGPAGRPGLLAASVIGTAAIAVFLLLFLTVVRPIRTLRDGVESGPCPWILDTMSFRLCRLRERSAVGPAARVGDKLVRPRVARPGSWWTRMRWVSIVQGGVVGAGGGRSVRSR
ncbi:Uncharacterised protein [Tsukamurella paurometabola]|nr:Uncharacterised protein [Tsukamurella paurometabola]